VWSLCWTFSVACKFVNWHAERVMVTCQGVLVQLQAAGSMLWAPMRFRSWDVRQVAGATPTLVVREGLLPNRVHE
jgi:hypothetical protein